MYLVEVRVMKKTFKEECIILEHLNLRTRIIAKINPIDETLIIDSPASKDTMAFNYQLEDK